MRLAAGRAVREQNSSAIDFYICKNISALSKISRKITRISGVLEICEKICAH